MEKISIKRQAIHIVIALIGVLLILIKYFVYKDDIFGFAGGSLIFGNLFIMELAEYKDKKKQGVNKGKFAMIICLIAFIINVVDLIFVIFK